MRRLAAALAVLVAAWGLWRWLGPGATDAPPAWITASLDRGPITASVTATGTIDPVDSVQVGTYVSGPIQELLADFNTPVQQGQLLARIDPRPYQLKADAAAADLATARARRARAEADRAFTRDTLTRMRQLAARGIVAASELDLAESQARQSAAQVEVERAGAEVAEAKLAEARVNLAYSEIRSPVTGVVVSRNVSVGQTVAASFQTPTLFLVATDLARMEVRVSVSESDIGAVAEGQEALFTVDAWPSEQFRGRVTQVRNAPVSLQNVVTYDVLVGVDNANLRLKPGMTANVQIVTARREDALRVPMAALRFRPPPERVDASAPAPLRGPTVWTPDPAGLAAPVAIGTGIADERFAEVTRGLAGGATVITGIARNPDEGAERPTLPGFGAAPGPPRR